MATNDYLTLAEYKTRNAIDSTDAADDALITAEITALSRWADRVTMGDPGWLNTADVVASARYFDGEGRIDLWIDECTSITTVQQAEYPFTSYSTMTADTDYWKSDGDRYDAAPYRLLEIVPSSSTFAYWPSGRRAVKITAVWGYAATTPEPVKEAVAIMVRELYLMKQSGGSGPGDVTVITDFGVIVPQAISSRARALLTPYKRGPL